MEASLFSALMFHSSLNITFPTPILYVFQLYTPFYMSLKTVFEICGLCQYQSLLMKEKGFNLLPNPITLYTCLLSPLKNVIFYFMSYM